MFCHAPNAVHKTHTIFVVFLTDWIITVCCFERNGHIFVCFLFPDVYIQELTKRFAKAFSFDIKKHCFDLRLKKIWGFDLRLKKIWCFNLNTIFHISLMFLKKTKKKIKKKK